MNHHYGSPDPPRTLAERLGRLDDGLRHLDWRLKESVAALVGDCVADAVRDGVRGLLGVEDPRRDHRDYRDDAPYRGPAPYRDDVDDPWGEQGRRWDDDDDGYATARETNAPGEDHGRRWRDAAVAALHAALRSLRREPRRPVLTTVAVALAAGLACFVAGPALAAAAAVLAAVAVMVFARDALRPAAESAAC